MPSHMLRNSLVAGGIALGVLFGIWTAGFAGEREITIQGELIGLACFISHGDMAKGEAHRKCALTCLEKGQPIGLLTDEGKVYILYADHEDIKPFETAKTHIGMRVEITGMAGKAGSLEGSTIKEVRPL